MLIGQFVIIVIEAMIIVFYIAQMMKWQNKATKWKYDYFALISVLDKERNNG